MKDLLLVRRAAVLLAAFCVTLAAPAQTLARPGWAGNGISAEPWWRNAIFYRIDVPHFQDSNGDGIGDLSGIAQRLDYLQSLGVDAIIIAPPADENAFSDLLHETNSRHIRVLIEPTQRKQPADFIADARLWLVRGAAGISIGPELLNPEDWFGFTPLKELHDLTSNFFLGQRILLLRGIDPPVGGGPDQRSRADLIDVPIDPGILVDDGTLRVGQGFTPRSTTLPAPSFPLLESRDGRPAQIFHGPRNIRSDGYQRIEAARLFTLRGAVSLIYGQELGLSLALARGSGDPATMQWTPTNVTPPKPRPASEEAAVKPQPPSDPNVYGSFKPYVQPKPVPKPKPADAPVDPNSLPGFTTGSVTGPENASPATVNVAVEDADPNSLLNFYRRLAQLHHDNASIRSGATEFLNHNAENALVWIRRTPAGSVTAGNVIVTCNLNDKPLTLSLDKDLETLHIHPGTLRPLLGSWTTTPISQYSNHITLPPYGVFIGELH
jgi:Alpha amylase, catalytic domain